ncbi:MAG: HlyD family efflux transporter periplasmic adaptor subunit [Bacillota bacterium]|nr:HlyD family efflux transporter periplasmic adaptor subunit [Bacillota bacterium]
MKKRFASLKIILFFLLLIFAGYYIFVNNLLNRDISYPLVYGNIDISIESDGFIIRDEKIITTNSSGKVQYFVAEGEKIKNNQLVAQIQTNASSKQNMDGEYPILPPSQNVGIDIEDLNYDIDFIFFKIKESIDNGRYSQIYGLKEELKLKLDKKTRLSVLDMPQDNKITVSEKTSDAVTQSVAPMSGIISYYIDGYENILKDINLYQIDFNLLNKQIMDAKNFSTQFVNEGDILYKVVNSNHWKFISLVDKFHQDFFDVGRIVQVVINGEKVSGEVVDIIDQGNNIAVLLNMNHTISDLQKIRKMHVELLPVNYKGLKIENNSLVKVDGEYGVYILNVNNKAVFRLVKIIGYDENFAIVVNDTFKRVINGKTTNVNTVEIYDEVLRNGEKYINK